MARFSLDTAALCCAAGMPPDMLWALSPLPPPLLRGPAMVPAHSAGASAERRMSALGPGASFAAALRLDANRCSGTAASTRQAHNATSIDQPPLSPTLPSGPPKTRKSATRTARATALTAPKVDRREAYLLRSAPSFLAAGPGAAIGHGGGRLPPSTFPSSADRLLRRALTSHPEPSSPAMVATAAAAREFDMACVVSVV
mmetsp:Transcript_7708/g.21940  ORF Transcript_7708/g.21940 Transcript_7708/m.21940 type:complete len:200 (-) Transcript_7708:87-686(-)